MKLAKTKPNQSKKVIPNKSWMINTAINRQYPKIYPKYNHHIKINKEKFKPNQVKIIKT